MVVFYLGEVNALVIHAALNGKRGRFRLGLRKMMITKNIDDRIAVRNYIALKVPLAAQLILKQELVYAGRLAVNAVVSTHHRRGLAFGYRRAKRGQIRINLIMFANGDVRLVARRFRTAVHGIVFGG